MTTAVESLPAAAWEHLHSDPALLAAIGSDPDGTPWLFQHTLQATVEGSGTCAVVLGMGSTWRTPNEYNTARFPHLSCDIYADPSRDADFNYVGDDTIDKIMVVFTALSALLHVPGSPEMTWGSTRVLGSHSSGEPLLYPVPDGDHMRRATALYRVMLG